MFGNLLKGLLTLMAAPSGADGSAEGGTPAAANAEDSLANAFGGAAGAEGQQTQGKTQTGDKAAGEAETGSGAVNSEIKLAAWTEQLPPEMRGNPETAAKLAKFNKVGDMAKAFLELEGKIASGGIPGDGATAEEVEAFWEKAGRPKTADGYAFAKDKENNGGEFAGLAHQANLTAAQAEAVYKGLNQLGAAKVQAAMLAQQQQFKETEAALKAEYGSKYPEKIELLTRGLAAAGPNVGSLLRQAGLAGNPEIAKAFIAFGEMTAESGFTRGKGAAGNSFVPASEGGNLYE